MTAAPDLLAEIRAAGAEVILDCGVVRIRVPRGALTALQRERLIEGRGEIAALLAKAANDRAVTDTARSDCGNPAVTAAPADVDAAPDPWLALSRVITKPGQPDGDDLAAWRAWVRKGAKQRHRVDGWPMDEAVRLAWGDAINAWHERHGAKPSPSRCAGCGSWTADSPRTTLPDGAVIHDDHRYLVCMGMYGEQWRGAAHDGLIALGLKAPVEVAP